jgi:SagB-type dehydrogenase family enzyme
MSRIVMAVGVFAIWAAGATWAEDLAVVELPAPERDGGKPLMQALALRQSQRAFAPDALSPQELANLLWAACGVNRSESGKRTAPTAVNWQEIDVYAALPQGLYLYDAKTHKLLPVLDQDIRQAAGKQGFVRTAPVVLIYVSDHARMGRAGEKDRDFYSATDTGFISQNVYLYCASAGLATVVVGMVDKPALEKTMGLRPDQKVILTQPVGRPSAPAPDAGNTGARP